MVGQPRRVARLLRCSHAISICSCCGPVTALLAERKGGTRMRDRKKTAQRAQPHKRTHLVVCADPLDAGDFGLELALRVRMSITVSYLHAIHSARRLIERQTSESLTGLSAVKLWVSQPASPSPSPAIHNATTSQRL